MSYEEWQKETGAKSEVQRRSENEALFRDASEGMRGIRGFALLNPMTDDERS